MLVVVDGNWYAHRLHHRLRGLYGPGNAPIGACFGFADLFKRLRDDQRITHWAIVFDHPEKSFRHRLDPQYKAQRPPMPDDLRRQMPQFIPLAEATGIPVLCLPDIEGDDTLAGFHTWGHHHDIPVRLATNDKDLEQVVDGNCQLWDPFSDTVRGPNEVLSRRGVRPQQIGDWLCLCGDTADNILGAPGIGPKRASKLLQTYGNIPNIFQNSHRLQPAQRRGLIDLRQRYQKVAALVALQPPTVSKLPSPAALRKTSLPADIETTIQAYRGLGLVAERFFPNVFQKKSEKTPSPHAPQKIQCEHLWGGAIKKPTEASWGFNREQCADDLAWWRDQGVAAEAAAQAERLPYQDDWHWLDKQTPHSQGSWNTPELKRLARFHQGLPRLMAQRHLARSAVRCLSHWLEIAQLPEIHQQHGRLRRLPSALAPPADLPEKFHPWHHVAPPSNHCLLMVEWPRLEWGLLAQASTCPTCQNLARGAYFSAPEQEKSTSFSPDPGQELAAKAATWRQLLQTPEAHTATKSQRWLKKALDEANKTGRLTTSFGRLITIDAQTRTSPWSLRVLTLAWLQGSAIDAMDWWINRWLARAQALAPSPTWRSSGLQWDHRAILALPESLLMDHAPTSFEPLQYDSHLDRHLADLLHYCRPNVSLLSRD